MVKLATQAENDETKNYFCTDEADRHTPKLACPNCGHRYSRVINSRGALGDSVRRRRVCSQCASRYSTAERVIAGSASPTSV